jgi:hypothetical protein
MDSPGALCASDVSSSASLSGGSRESSPEPSLLSTSALVRLDALVPAGTPIGIHVVDYDIVAGSWSVFTARLRNALGSYVVHRTLYDNASEQVWGDIAFFPAFFFVGANRQPYEYRGERTIASVVQAYKEF